MLVEDMQHALQAAPHRRNNEGTYTGAYEAWPLKIRSRNPHSDPGGDGGSLGTVARTARHAGGVGDTDGKIGRQTVIHRSSDLPKAKEGPMHSK